MLLGGFNEIGMNLNLFGYGLFENCVWIMVDFGVMFGDEWMFGIDFIMFDLEYIFEYVDDFVGLVLIYGYEDYIGVVVYFWFEIRCLIYVMLFMVEFVKGKFCDLGWIEELLINVIFLGVCFDLGFFNIEFIILIYLIFEFNGLVI